MGTSLMGPQKVHAESSLAWPCVGLFPRALKMHVPLQTCTGVLRAVLLTGARRPGGRNQQSTQ